ncbi:MAG: DNA cytosine methyltransferase, partial [Oscillospiraceae bacterium]|nr:DNA cytosine methyltransferase [Oscillospiraceae bacterium]
VIQKYDPAHDLGRWPQVRELLNKYCGYSLADDEIILLLIDGAAYYIRDILLRMLSPRELYLAMGFPPDYKIDRDYMGNQYGKTKQVARCGNAVCPPMAEAVVRANYVSAPVYITTMAQFANFVSV